MNDGTSHMSTPPPGYGTPPPGYGGAPPVYGQQPPPKNNTAKIILIVLGVIFGGGVLVIAILAAILFPVFAKVRGNARLSVCNSHVKQIGLGLTEYTQDNNEKFPKGDYVSALMPFVKSETVFRCPADQTGGLAYSFNKNLQGISLAEISDTSKTVAIYEGKNQSLDFRHEHEGSNVAVVGFADGNVKDISQSQAGSLRWKP